MQTKNMASTVHDESAVDKISFILLVFKSNANPFNLGIIDFKRFERSVNEIPISGIHEDYVVTHTHTHTHTN